MRTSGVIALMAIVGGAMAWFSIKGLGMPAPPPAPGGGTWEKWEGWVPEPELIPVTVVSRAGWESAKVPAIGEVGVVTIGAMPGEPSSSQRIYKTVPVTQGNPVTITYETSTGVAIPVQITAPPTAANPIPTSIQIVNGQQYYMGMPL